MIKPYIICHMLSSMDGRIDGNALVQSLRRASTRLPARSSMATPRPPQSAAPALPALDRFAIKLKRSLEREKAMEYTKLGNTGMDVSRICLGCMGFGDAERGVHKWVLNDESSQPIIKKALELGVNFFDTANVYAGGTSEEILGHGLKDFANRDEVVIATKVHGKCTTDRMAPGYRARRS